MVKREKVHIKHHLKKKEGYLTQINPFVAGVDICSGSHFVAAPVPTEKTDNLEICVREFSSFTSDLEDLVDWLKQC